MRAMIDYLIDAADFAVSCEHNTVVVRELPLLELLRRSS